MSNWFQTLNIFNSLLNLFLSVEKSIKLLANLSDILFNGIVFGIGLFMDIFSNIL